MNPRTLTLIFCDKCVQERTLNVDSKPYEINRLVEEDRQVRWGPRDQVDHQQDHTQTSSCVGQVQWLWRVSSFFRPHCSHTLNCQRDVCVDLGQGWGT